MNKKILIKEAFLLVLLLIVTGSAWAQSHVTLTGTVKDNKGNVLSMASVSVKNSIMGTYTNDDGEYELKVKSGKLTLVSQLIGYETKELEIDTRKQTKIDITLTETGFNLQDVIVVGKSQEQQLREGAYTVSAVDIKSIASSVTNLNDLISRSSGVKVRTEGGLGSDFELSLNGLSGNSIRYFVDGLPLSSKGNGVNLSNFPINTIDRIEVYKGVVPSYLGADALGGAINIITKQEKTNFVDASVSAGSFSTYMADFNSQFVLNKTGIILRPQFSVNSSKNDYKVHNVEVWNSETARYDTVTRKRFHDDYFNAMVQLEAGVQNKKWADQFFVGGSFTQTNKEIQTGTIQSIVYGKAERKQDAWNINMKYKKDNFLTEGLSLNISASHTWDHSLTIDTAYARYNWNGGYQYKSSNEMTSRGRQYRHYKRPLTIIRANFNYALNNHHSFNLNYMLNRSGNKRYDTASDYYPENEIDGTFTPSEDLLSKQVLGLSYDQSLGKDGRWVNSFFLKDYINHVRVEQTDLAWITGSNKVPSTTTKNNLGGGVGSRFTIFEPLSIKLSYERSVRLPQARELLGNGSTTYPNLALEPEKSHNVNIGLFGNIQPSRKHLIYYEFTAFYRKVTDYIHLRVNESDGTAQYFNVNDVTSKGLEGEIRYSWGRWLQLTGNLSYQESRDMERYLENGNESATYKNRIPNKPWLYSNIDLTLNKYDLLSQGDRLRFNLLYQYVHWYYLTWESYGYLPNKARIPEQNVFNASLTYSWQQERYSLTLTCDNVFNKLSFDNYKLQKPGRTFMAKFRVYIR